MQENETTASAREAGHPVIDLARDLEEITRLAAEPARVDDLLEKALDYLAAVIPYKLAAVLELRGDELAVRCARGPLAGAGVRAHRLALARFPSMRRVLETRDARLVREEEHAGSEGDLYDGVLDLPHGHSCMVVPLYAGEKSLGLMSFDNPECDRYDAATLAIASVFGQIVALAMATAEQAALLDRYRLQLQQQNRLLVEQSGAPAEAARMLGRTRNPAMRRVVDMVRHAAVTAAPVLITGETGTGKEVLARALHEWSPRVRGPFVAVNCAALPRDILESELFGHRKGAFTGAIADRAGRFALANGGTLFLDEVGELSTAAQVTLLRVLEEGRFEPVGSDRTVKVDVRIVAATNAHLRRAIAAGRFRQDLFYRLNVFPVEVPPLRERTEDIPGIATGALAAIEQHSGRGPWSIPRAELDRLIAHPWPGNVRELINAIERATILVPSGPLVFDPPDSGARALPAHRGAPADARVDPAEVRTLLEIEREHIAFALRASGGRIYGKNGAAELLGMKPTTLQSRMRRLGVAR